MLVYLKLSPNSKALGVGVPGPLTLSEMAFSRRHRAVCGTSLTVNERLL